MNQHPIYTTVASPRGSSSPHNRILETLKPAELLTFSQSNTSFHSQTTTYYTPAPTTFHENPSALSTQDQNSDYLLVSSRIPTELNPHDSLQSRLPVLSSSLSTWENELLSSTLSKEHQQVAHAGRMDAFINMYVVGHESSNSQDIEGSCQEHDEFEHVVKSATNQDMEARKKEQREMERRVRDRKELDALLQESNDGEVNLKKYREKLSKMRRAEAARSRYHRMSVEERKIYNHRRHLRKLGIDPDIPESDFVDNEVVRERIKMANAKKAKAKRLRYHRMSIEERREYNERHKSLRKLPVVEESLPSPPAGRNSPEALQTEQRIRNARKAEAARARYHKMSPEQRKRRDQAKKLRAMGSEKRGMISSDCSIDGSIAGSSGLSSCSSQVSHSTDDVFEQMEREVINRTKKAQKALALQQQQSQASPFWPIYQQLVDGDRMLIIDARQIMADEAYTQTDSSQVGMRIQPQPQPESLCRTLPVSMGNTTISTVADLVRAERAAKARERYCSMRPDIRQQKSAKRAELLRKARQRDVELCLLAERCQLETLDEQTRISIVDAQKRRAREAEQRRMKYYSMNSEQRRKYNAVRYAQRRQRRRELMEARQQFIMNACVSTETAQTPNSLSPMSESTSSNDHILSAGGSEPGQFASSTYEIH